MKMKYDLSYTTDRELSWLLFNLRVLEEAEKKKNPLLERLRFISIFNTNLDEFFMVRVGSLEDRAILSPAERDNKSGLTPALELKAIYEAIPPMLKRRDEAYERVISRLSRRKVSLLKYESLKGREKKFVNDYYDYFVRPFLSPQVVERAHPFPHLKNKAVYAAALLSSMRGDKRSIGIVEIPETVPKLIYLKNDEKIRFVRTEDVVAGQLNKLFKRYEVLEKALISVTRNADISLDDDSRSDKYREHMEVLLSARDRLAPVRLEVEGEAKNLVKALSKNLALSKNRIYFSSSPALLGWAYRIAPERSDLLYPPFSPLWPEYLDSKASMESQIRERDILLFYPYHSMRPFLDLLRDAASDKAVRSIDITLYRVARDSEVVKHLIEAASRGKEVTVLLELRARFDEEHNIEWAKVLERAGCHIIYGPEDFKCHSKICLITYEHAGKISYITQVGTGNYNEKTAAQYTDFCLMSADTRLARDAEKFFKNMVAGRPSDSYDFLMVAPRDMKRKLISLIEREMKKGDRGRITIKTNAVTERDLIDKLSEASGAGVRIELIVRGISCIVPGVPGKTDHIRVTSIVGRFLEHSRIYAFGEGEDRLIYISSADLMTRNQDHRVEIACPIESPELKSWFDSYLSLLLSDTLNARELVYPGEYIKKNTERETPLDIHQYFIDHPVRLSPSMRPVARLKRRLKSIFSA